MTFGEKIKEARIEAGLTQEELAVMLSVSRAAIAKWESNRGMPDVTNLKAIANILNMSVDYLLNDGNALDLSVTKKAIDLTKYGDSGKLSRRKKIDIKERIVREEYPGAEILRLTVTKFKNSKAENIADSAIGWISLVFGDIPLFGTQEFGKALNSLDQQYYLVNEKSMQHFVLLTDEHMISRITGTNITEKKFDVGNQSFLVVGKVE